MDPEGMDRWIVSVACKITLPALHWWQDDRDIVTISLYAIFAPSEALAIAQAVSKHWNWCREQHPNGLVEIQDTYCRSLKNLRQQFDEMSKPSEG